MRRLIALGVLALAAVPGALAGGWASVGLTPLPPDDIQAGDTWMPQVTVLRHGMTPTDGATPSITIDSGGERQTIALRPTGKTGVYSATVVFPHAGTWSYAIDNGLAGTGYGVSATTTYKPIEVGGASASDGSTVPGGWATGAAVGLALALLAAWQLRSRRPSKHPQTACSAPRRALCPARGPRRRVAPRQRGTRASRVEARHDHLAAGLARERKRAPRCKTIEW